MKKPTFTLFDLRFVIVCSALSAVSSPAGAQQTLIWDPNGGATGTGGTGTWNTSAPNWASGTTFQTWNNSAFDNARFEETPGTVTVGTPINVQRMNFAVGGYSLVGSNSVTLGGASPFITISTTDAPTKFQAPLAGSVNWTKSGLGTLVLSNSNTGLSGAVTVTGGMLQIDHVNALGTSTAASQLMLNKNSGFYFNVDYAHDFTLMGSTVNVQGGNYTWSGSPILTASTILNLSGVSGTLSGNYDDDGVAVLSVTRNGDGRMTLSGNNTYVGPTRISRGILQLGSAGALSSGSNLVFNGAAGNGGTIELTSASNNFNRNLGLGPEQVQWTGDGGFLSNGSNRVVNIGGAGGTLTWGSGSFVPTGNRLILGTSSANSLDFRNGIDLGADTRIIQVKGGSIDGHAQVSGVLSGTGALHVMGTGNDMLELTGANAYSGGTILTSSILVVDADNNMGASTGTLAFDGGTLENTGTFATARNVFLNAGGGTFRTDANLEVAGTISGAGSLTKTGAARLTLTGSNTYAGGTTIDAGILQIGSGGTTGSIAGNVTNNGTLAFNRSGDLSYGGIISGTGALNKQGSGRLVLTGQNTYTGGTVIDAGNLQIGNGGTTGSIVGNVDNNGLLVFNRSDDMSYGGVISGSGLLTKDGGGRLILTGENTYTGNTTVSAGTLQIGNGGTTGSVAGNVINHAVLAFNRSDETIFSGSITGTGSIEQQGPGKVTLAGPNIAASNIKINGGALQVGAGGPAGAISGNVSNHGQLIFNHSGNTVYGGTISGTGGLYKEGNGTLVLTGENAYAGGTVINAGALQIGNGGVTGNIVGDVSNNGILTFNRSGDIIYGGRISGSGGLTKHGNGRLVLTGENTYVGNTTVIAGMLQIGDGGTSGSIAGNVNNSGTLVFNRSDGMNFDGAISGTGSVQKTGAGSLIVAGTNTYTGGTTIAAGTFQIGNGGTTGSIGGDVNNNGMLVFNRSDDIGYAGVMSGGGALTKQGGGVLVLTGENTYTGGTTISAGALQVGDGGATGSILGNVSNNAVLIFNRSAGMAYGGVISGTGTLNKHGNGTLVLTGENTYTGGTSIGAGTLQIGSGGPTGSIAGNVNNNGMLAFNRSDDIHYGGMISGAGALNKQGSGRLVLTGENTYTGGTAINSGTLQIGEGGSTGSITGNVSNNGTLVFNRSNDLGYSGAISGSGTVVKDGAGTLGLTGDSGAFQGSTFVNTGTLAVNGVLGGVVNIDADARLQGAGTVGAGIVAGTIAPGNSIGTMQVSGNYMQLPGSTYEVEINPAGSSDRIAVGGAANIQGGTVAVIPASGVYSADTRYTILTAAGGRTGAFSGLTQSLPFLDLALSYDPNNVYLDTLGRNTVAFCAVAVTSNQCAAGQGVENLSSAHSLYGAIAGLSDQNIVRRAFDRLSGELHASAKGVMIEDTRFLREAVNDRLRQAFSWRGAPVSRASGQTLQENGATGHAFWTRAFGSFGHRSGDMNAARVGRNIGGFFMGGDTLVADILRLGIAGGYSNSSFTVNERYSTGSSDNYHVTLYGGTRWHALALRFGGSYTWHDLETNRNIFFPGFNNQVKADYRGRTGQVFGELGYDLPFRSVSLEPFVGVAYVNLATKGFQEQGGLAALGSSRDNEGVTYSTVGMNAASMFSTPGGMTARLRGRLGWRHAFDSVPTRSALTFNGGSTFALAGTPIAQDAMIMAAGLDANVGRNAILGIAYTGQIFDNVVDNGVRANLDWRF
jgi:outer membrane autotransporter protein